MDWDNPDCSSTNPTGKILTANFPPSFNICHRYMLKVGHTVYINILF